jgi:hypothetical protein
MDLSVRREIEKRLEANFRWYLANQDELLKTYNGKHLIIVDKRVAEAYDTDMEAYVAGRKKYGAGNFSLQKCSPGDKDWAIHVTFPCLPANSTRL